MRCQQTYSAELFAILVEERSKAAMYVQVVTGQTVCRVFRLAPYGQSNGNAGGISRVQMFPPKTGRAEEPAFLSNLSNKACLVVRSGTLRLNRDNKAWRTGAIILDDALKLLTQICEVEAPS